jgi:hypothetical protein
MIVMKKALILLVLSALGLQAFAQPSVFKDQTIFVQVDPGQTTTEALSNFDGAPLISKEQAIEIAQEALFKFKAPAEVSLALEKDGEQHYLVWKVVFDDGFMARVNAGTGYALTGYVDNE